jgi:hypothetical protein
MTCFILPQNDSKRMMSVPMRHSMVTVLVSLVSVTVMRKASLISVDGVGGFRRTDRDQTFPVTAPIPISPSHAYVER